MGTLLPFKVAGKGCVRLRSFKDRPSTTSLRFPLQRHSGRMCCTSSADVHLGLNSIPQPAYHRQREKIVLGSVRSALAISVGYTLPISIPTMKTITLPDHSNTASCPTTTIGDRRTRLLSS